jgi:hypothetical protein
MPIPEGYMMKIWYDACTGKHVRYGVSIARRLRASGHEVTFTTRRHPDTVHVAQFLNEKSIVVGKYDPTSLLSRLREGTHRQLLFCKMFEKNLPDIAISHGSVDQCRVAFGLGKPIILTFDAPQADAVNRLTLPLASYLVLSKSIPLEVVQKYNVRGELITFDGVDEVAWMKDFEPTRRYDFGEPLIVVRQFETRAMYAREKLDFFPLAKKLTRLGKVVFLSRYTRRSIEGLVTPKRFVDSASLVAQADLFVGGGGTITREAALKGTPAIIIKPFENQYVNEYLKRKGFPIFEIKPSEAFNRAKELLGKKTDVTSMLSRLENPVDVVADIVERIEEENEEISA